MARSPLSISILTSNGVWNVTIKISALGCNCDLCSISFIPSLIYSSNIKCFCEPCIENKKNREKLHMILEISLSLGEIDTNTIIHNIIINSLYHHYTKHLELLGKMQILRRVILVWLCKKNNGELINTFDYLKNIMSTVHYIMEMTIHPIYVQLQPQKLQLQSLERPQPSCPWKPDQ